MAEIARATVNWTNFIGAPGYTNFYFRDFSGAGAIDQAIVDGFVTKVDAFLDSFVGSVPLGVSFIVDPTIEVIEETTGEMQAFFTGTPDTVRAGGDAGAYSAASGGCINWYTDGVRNGRRVRGRSFMVPLGESAYGTDGTLDNTRITTLRAACTTFISAVGAGDLGVWSRPSAPAAADGVWYVATSFTFPDKAAVLRSRRD